ncbi:Type II restriction enzyme, methylase subunit YeeA [Serinibacter arcticus]|uniref:site-specific DNA-methyltransferase (adenine-specific) n=1 Tax=Serinibacter arcticus TaxID=1655435 RepID=A0A4Z1DZM3_9MICO|nr:Type II restriction enzyme, methylase subunit YeeA [Serinibacter arcticus]
MLDNGDLRTLFVDELGWSNADRGPVTLTSSGQFYSLAPVASYKGMRIWSCGALPPRTIQRDLDAQLGKDNIERLIIFSDSKRQEWRWPRRGEAAGSNSALMNHQHTIGTPNPELLERLAAITIGFDEDPSLIEVLARMRSAFNRESETAAVRAARLMGDLYTQLEVAGVEEDSATLLLSRLLFLLFADDTGMWKSKPDLFASYLELHTSADTLHVDLGALFDVLDTDEKDRGHLALDSPYRVFRHVNGRLFAESLALPPLTAQFRLTLLEAAEFDWGRISPAVFGSMFQTVKDKDSRRAGGEHYTTEQNIIKTIGPLFLDELHDRFDAAYDDKAQLTRLHNDLGRLRILDPACGCGNFLIVAYRELRALELQVLARRRDLDSQSGIHTGGINRSQMTLDVSNLVKVRLDHFYGIEIDEWPARIAGTAMLLVDHLANQLMEEEFGLAPDRLPVKIVAEIHHENALRVDWATIIEPSDDVIIVGNPPFVGRKYRNTEQAADMKFVWGKAYNVNLDFVTSWYAKTLEYFGDHRGRWAFVSTNSISQGEPVASLWGPILKAGWRCRFAHRSFKWTTEAKGGAAVHVSIVGFDRGRTTPRPTLYRYPHGPAADAVPTEVRNINPYLMDGPNVLITKPGRPLNPQMPAVGLGSMPNDGKGNLLVSRAQLADVQADPIAAKYVRPLVGTDELLYGKERWCLWLADADPVDLETSPVLRARLDACAKARRASKNPDTVAMADHPHLFWHIAQPSAPYLCIPGVVSEARSYFTPAHFEPDVVTSNAAFLATDPDGFAFAILSSSLFMTWLQTFTGRLKSDLRFSRTFTYDSFPLPHVSAGQRKAIVTAGHVVLAARAAHPGQTLAQLYGAYMPADVADAHAEVDRAVDEVFGATPTLGEEGRALLLLKSYETLISQAPRRN